MDNLKKQDETNEYSEELNELESLVNDSISSLSDLNRDIAYNNAYSSKQKSNLQILLEKQIGGLTVLKASIKSLWDKMGQLKSNLLKNSVTKKKTAKDNIND